MDLEFVFLTKYRATSETISSILPFLRNQYCTLHLMHFENVKEMKNEEFSLSLSYSTKKLNK